LPLNTGRQTRLPHLAVFNRSCASGASMQAWARNGLEHLSPLWRCESSRGMARMRFAGIDANEICAVACGDLCASDILVVCMPRCSACTHSREEQRAGVGRRHVVSSRLWISGHACACRKISLYDIRTVAVVTNVGFHAGGAVNNEGGRGGRCLTCWFGTAPHRLRNILARACTPRNSATCPNLFYGSWSQKRLWKMRRCAALRASLLSDRLASNLWYGARARDIHSWRWCDFMAARIVFSAGSAARISAVRRVASHRFTCRAASSGDAARMRWR